MLWPTIAKCYKEIVEDPTLLWLFFREEYSSIQELPCLGALQFRLILEGFFTCIASPDNWGKTRVEFLALTSLKRSGEATKSAILIINGVAERDLGMMMVFCHPNQAKIEACDALSTLHQCDSLGPSVVVMRRYSNTPYIPWGTSHSLYLDVVTLSGGTFSAQFPQDRLHLHWGVAPMSGGGREAGNIPPSSRDSVGGFKREHHLSGLISLLVPMSALPPHLEEGSQTEGGSGYHPALKLLQDPNQARGQLEYELVQETQELTERYEHKQAKQARRHARQWAQMIDQTDATYQEVSSQASLTEAVKLLPWCISAVMPFHYISRLVTIAAQQDKGIPTVSEPSPTAPEPEPHGSSNPGLSGGLTLPTGTPPLPVSSLPDMPLAGTPWWGTIFLTS